MSSCSTCGGRDYLCQQCKMDELENRLGLPSDHFDADAGIVCWVQDVDETWHASMYFEDTRHVAACGEIFETPVADVRDDPRRLANVHTCDDCEAALEADEEETVPDGGEFAKASELVTDGGVDQASGDTEREPPTYEEQREAIEEMLDVQWSTNWTPLPADAEGHVEQAFEHLAEARDIAERESRQQDTGGEQQ